MSMPKTSTPGHSRERNWRREESRRKQSVVSVRMLPERHAELVALAETCNLSAADCARAIVLESEPERSGSRRIVLPGDVAMVRVLRLLRDVMGQLGYVANNLAQLVVVSDDPDERGRVPRREVDAAAAEIAAQTEIVDGLATRVFSVLKEGVS